MNETKRNPDTGEEEKVCHILYQDGDAEDMTYETALEHFDAQCDEEYTALLGRVIPAFEYLENRLNDNCVQTFGCYEENELFRYAPH